MQGLAAMLQVVLQLTGSTSIIINTGTIAFGLQQGSLMQVQGTLDISFLSHGDSEMHPAVITGSSQAARVCWACCWSSCLHRLVHSGTG
jgi:hypothetical protein